MKNSNVKPFWMISFGVNRSHMHDFVKDSNGNACFDKRKDAIKMFDDYVLLDGYNCKQLTRTDADGFVVQLEEVR